MIKIILHLFLIQVNCKQSSNAWDVGTHNNNYKNERPKETGSGEY
jgi:hypothetical protein